MLTPKQNVENMYFHKKIDRMPGPGEGEYCIYPVSGFLERPANNKGGLDWFGCNWEYIEGSDAPAPDVHNHVLEEISDWKEVVKFPDLDAWDWEHAKQVDRVEEIDRENNLVNMAVCNGMFERLHVLMGFEDALCALVAETEEVEAFFDAMVNYKIKLIEKLKIHYNPDVITFHDDWGTQKALFFSPVLWRRLIKPRMKKIVDFAHQCGIGFIMHSCGKLDEIMEDICEIGIDTLQCMDINDLENALKIAGGRMSIQASVHTQDFEAKDESGSLTEKIVRETVSKEFMTLGATGRYFPFLFITPDSKWYEKVVLDEFLKCRDKLAAE